MSLTGTWAISQTATDTLSISREVVIAATSDNIQVIALLACEGFGATLPICAESCAKAHQLCSRSHESTFVSFLKAQIGFPKGDCGWQLSQSDAGLRFLALAACLLTIDGWRAAEMLRGLITATAADKTLVPTSQQLKQLLTALNYRLACSGFTDNVVGWKIILEKTGYDGVTITPPSSDILSRLIAALSDLERLGESQSVHVETACDVGAWIIAFIKWCLGEPPTVILPTESRAESSSRVYLHLQPFGQSRDMKIWTQDVIGSIRNLWTGRSMEAGTEDFHGMVHLPHLADRLMMVFGPEAGLGRRAAREAISSGCRPVLERFRRIGSQNRCEMPNIAISQGGIFPDEEDVAHTLALFLKKSPESMLKTLPENVLVEDLPSVALVKTHFAAHCPCPNCLNTSRSPKQLCLFDKFLREVSKCIATVLLASLFVSNTPEAIFFHLPLGKLHIFDKFTHTVYNCVRNSGEQSCSSETIVGEVLKLIGHNDDRLVTAKDWIMSVHHGQTVYPQILSSMTLQKTGLLNLICVPGSIIYNGEIYSLVEIPQRLHIRCDGSHYDELSEESDASDGDDCDIDIDAFSLPVEDQIIQTAHDEYKGETVEWQVTAMDGRLSLSISSPNQRYFSQRERNPMHAIWTANKSFFVTCAHDRNVPLPKYNPWLVDTVPLRPDLGRRAHKCGLVHADRNETMRFFTLCAGRAGVVSDDACLACCVDACQSLNLTFILC